MFWWGGGRGGGGLSVTQWHMESDGQEWHVGGSGMDLGTDVGKWGAEGAGKSCLASQKGKLFFYPRVCTENAEVFVENSNVGDKHENNSVPLTRPPSRPLAAGPSIRHLSLKGGGWTA